MEYCQGGDLSSVLKLEGSFAEPRARIYSAEILLAI
jgi:serine/threonine protein kinase